MSGLRFFINGKSFNRVISLFCCTLMLTVSCSQAITPEENFTGEVRGNVRHVNVLLWNYQFEPRTYQFSSGELVEFNFKSNDGVHTFSIEQLGIDWVIDSDTPKIQSYTFTEPGEYKLICLIPPHASLGMVGSIIVK